MRLIHFVTVKIAALGLAAIALAACSTTNLGDAAKLAQAGQTASASLAQYYGNSADRLPGVIEMEILRSSVDPGVSGPSPAMISSINSVQKSLNARAGVARSLTGLYDAMYEVSATDYADGFKAASKDLYGSIGALATAVGAPNPVTDERIALLDGAFTMLIVEKQKKRAGIANGIVLRQLELLPPLLAKDRNAVVGILRATEQQHAQSSIALWYAGVVSAKELLSAYGGVDGLELTSEEADFTAANPRLREAVPAIIRYRMGQIRAAEEARYAAFEETVTDLIRRHRLVAEGAPFDLSTLLARAAELKALADRERAAATE